MRFVLGWRPWGRDEAIHCVRLPVGAWVSATLLALLGGVADAAHISVGNVSGAPGTTVEVPVYIQGDGVVAGTDMNLVFGQEKLSLSVASGTIPGAAREGNCSRVTGDQLVAVVTAGAGAVLPNRLVTVCVIPFVINSIAEPGVVPVVPIHYTCGGAQGQALPCTATHGSVQVTGQSSAMSMTMATSGPYTLDVMLRRGGPSVDEIMANAPNAQLLPGVFRAHPPASLRPLVTDRPRGDRRRRIDAQRGTPEDQLDRYLVAEYRTVEARNAALDAARNDQRIEAAVAYDPAPVPIITNRGSKNAGAVPKTTGEADQFHLPMHKITEAQKIAEGWGLVAVIDQGADPDHAELRSRTSSGSTAGSLVPGGPILPYYSKNMVVVAGEEDPVAIARDLREGQSQKESIDTDACDALDGSNDDRVAPSLFGHGTHVTGLVAANGIDGPGSSSNAGVRGACLRCGIQVLRTAEVRCFESIPEVNYSQLVEHVANGMGQAMRNGAQIMNMSFGYAQNPSPCSSNADDLLCKKLKIARERDVLVVGASGNHLKPVQFPASEPDVVAVGGLNRYVVDHESGFWSDRTDLGFAGCPFEHVPNTRECGSNSSNNAPLTSRQEIVVPAKDVVSTMPVNTNWSDMPKIPCGDNGVHVVSCGCI